MASKKIVFIHGMYMTPACWDQWAQRFSAKGYDCIAPGWPGRDCSVAEVRARQPEAALTQITLTAVLDKLAGVIGQLGEKPILIGHSIGGLVTQLLHQRGIACASVSIDSAPPQGLISLKWPFLKANWGHVNPFVPRNQPAVMDFERFQYAFVNGMPLERQRAAFETFVIPESRRVPAETLTSTARIDFRKPGAPLLLIAGSDDHLIPPSLNRANFEKYQRAGSVTDFKEFAGRNHFIIGQPGWEEVADYAESWLARVTA